MSRQNNETSEYVKREAIAQKSTGKSSREIARILGVSKSWVNNVYNQHMKFKGQPKILYIDIESAPSIAAAFGRFKVNITHDHVLSEGGWFLSACWTWNYSDKVEGLVLTPAEACKKDDSRIISKLHELISAADVVIAHNAKDFDVKMFNTRCILNGFYPANSAKITDTLVIARRFKFNSNKLDSLCDYFNLGRKIQHQGIQLWIKCMEGNKEALKEMLAYNKEDVVLLKKLHDCLRPWDTQPINAGHFIDLDGSSPVCPQCGSWHVLKTGKLVYNGVSSYTEYQCGTCGSLSRNRQSTVPKEKRKSLLTPVR